MFTNQNTRRSFFLLFWTVLAFSFGSAAHSEEQKSVCAKVKLQMSQSAVITRSAFSATLEVNNGSPSNLENVKVSLDIRDAGKQPANDKFGLRAPVLTKISAVDGTGVILAETTGKAQWTLVPTRDAAPNGPTQYTVGGTLSYTQDGEQITVPLYPAPIEVLPDPSLAVKYFWQRDVYSDDPFTPEIEPAEPFDLGLMMTNKGKGAAKDVTITSAQPQITDNEKGLVVDFKLLNTQIGRELVSNSFTTHLGTIEPADTAVARWQMSASLAGKFTDFKASYKHVDELNAPRLSLIESLSTHELIHTVRADAPKDDQVPDFLVNDEADEKGLPDALHLSNGTVAPVSAVTTATTDGAALPGHLQVALKSIKQTGWSYIEIPDPANALLPLLGVKRSDGKTVLLDWNAWTTSRTKRPKGQSPVKENLFHLLDFNSTGSYTLIFGQPSTEGDVTAPTSSVSPLPNGSLEDFAVQWSGTDGPLGSGIAFYDIYVSVNGGDFAPWLQRTTQTGALYKGTAGTTYAFYSRATDRAGNVEDAPTLPDTSTRVVVSQPDLLVKRGADADSAFGANGVYQAVPDGTQTAAQSAPSGTQTQYVVKVENDGTTTDSFVLKSVESAGDGWTTDYLVDGQSIRSQLLGDGYVTDAIEAGKSQTLTVTITPDTSVAPGKSKSATISVFRDSFDTKARDSVKMTTTSYAVKTGIVAFSSPTYSVAENTKTHLAKITVTRSSGSEGAASVDFAATPATASALDFVPTKGTLSFAPGETSKSFNVAILDDSLIEGTETVKLSLSNPKGTALGLSSAVLNIVDNEKAPSLRISDAKVVEGNKGTTNAVFTVTLSAPSAQKVQVGFATANGSAIAPGDYGSQSGTLLFAPGQTSKTITVRVVGDTLPEADETFKVNLSSPVGATLADAQGIGTIVNDDKSAFAIDGQITDKAGKPIEGVTVSASRTTPTNSPIVVAKTNAMGFYHLVGLAPGTYSLRASKTDVTFLPAVLNAVMGNQNLIGRNFTGYYSLRGAVRDEANKPVMGVKISLSGKSSATAITNSSGEYRFDGLSPGAYIVAPSSSETARDFAPRSYDLSIANASLSGKDFKATPRRLSIEGRVSDFRGAGGVPNVSVSATAAGATQPAAVVLSDASGNYVLPKLAPGTYTVSATSKGMTFKPPVYRAVTLTSIKATNINFRAAFSAAPSVTETSGQPMADADIHLASAPAESSASTSTTRRKRSAVNGTFDFASSGTAQFVAR